MILEAFVKGKVTISYFVFFKYLLSLSAKIHKNVCFLCVFRCRFDFRETPVKITGFGPSSRQKRIPLEISVKIHLTRAPEDVIKPRL